MAKIPPKPRRTRHLVATVRPSSTDVAKRAGVSQPTVSRVYTPGAPVSDAVRERVLRAADELGYRPSALPGILQSGRSGLVAAVVSSLSVPEIAVLLGELAEQMRQHQRYILVTALGPRDRLHDVVDALMGYRVDALAIIGPEVQADTAARLNDLGIPAAIVSLCTVPRRRPATSGDARQAEEASAWLLSSAKGVRVIPA